MRSVTEKAKRKNTLLYNCFVDFKKVFESVPLNITWTILLSLGKGTRLVEILQNIDESQKEAESMSQN